ncbi:MAG: Rieske 2Fe-2S domain-containing protein [Thermoleophilia bacterium]
MDQVPPGEGREFAVGDHRIAVFRLRDGRVAATDARCPHKGGPLADGIVGRSSVVCPLHARRYAFADGADADGGCGLAVHPVHVDDEGELVVVLPAT